ncbi:MAG: hypothetical protein ACREJU_00575 [Nitrospiraceae bacterium]
MNVGKAIRRLVGAAARSEAKPAQHPHLEADRGALQRADTDAQRVPLEPDVEVIDSRTRYGRLLGGATAEYILRVYLKFINDTQEPVIVKSVSIALDGSPLNSLLILGPSLPVLLTSSGQEQLRTDKLYAAPVSIPSVSIVERYAFFQLPASFQRESQSLHCTATVIFSKHAPRETRFIVNW